MKAVAIATYVFALSFVLVSVFYSFTNYKTNAINNIIVAKDVVMLDLKQKIFAKNIVYIVKKIIESNLKFKYIDREKIKKEIINSIRLLSGKNLKSQDIKILLDKTNESVTKAKIDFIVSTVSTNFLVKNAFAEKSLFPKTIRIVCDEKCKTLKNYYLRWR